MNDRLWGILANEFSGNIAARHVLELSRFHRIAGGGDGYHKAVEYVAGVMKSLGSYQVDISKDFSDGERMYLLWRSMPGWDVRRAELSLDGTGEILARYADIPVSVFEYSQSADISAVAVFAGKGVADSDYEGLSVAGKIVVATGDGEIVHREAVVKRGAAGVVVGPDDSDTLSLLYPDLVRLFTIRCNKSLRERSRFGFSLSYRQFQKLTEALKSSKDLRLRVVVNARLFDSETETVSAYIKGSRYPDQEMILTAHLDHYSPGANDNASGSAALLEIARTLSVLIEQGRISPPARSIRFLWVGEMHGFAGYLARDVSIGSRGVAGLNLDMVGEDLNKTLSVLDLVRPPDANPSFIGDLVENMISRVDDMKASPPLGEAGRIHWRVKPYEGGSDHFMLSDSTIGVSSVCLGHPEDIFHHTSLDNLDKINVHELGKTGLIALGTLLFVAWAEEADVLTLALDVAERGFRRIAEQTARSTVEFLKLCGDASALPALSKYLEEDLTFIDARVRAETRAVASVEKLSMASRVRELVVTLAADLDRQRESERARLTRYFAELSTLKKIPPGPPRADPEENELKTIVPRRLFRGPISQYYFEDLLGEDGRWYSAYAEKDPSWSDRRAEILNFMDGRHNLLDIYCAVSAELGRSDKTYYLRLLGDLKKHRLVSY